MSEIEYAVERTINAYADVLYERVRDKWKAFDKGIFTDHYTIDNELQKNGNTYIKVLEFGGVGAWNLEYGTGSRMVSSGAFPSGNPWLSEYFGAEYWNTNRAYHSNHFLGRAKGDKIFRPDGTVDESTGKNKGKDLSKVYVDGDPLFIEQEPMMIISTETGLWVEELKEALKDNLASAVLKEITKDIE